MSAHKFYRGQIVKALCDMCVGGELYIHQWRTYVVNKTMKDAHGHCYILVLGTDNEGHWITQDNFTRISI